MVVLVVGAAVLLVRSPLLDVDHVRAVGATRTGREAVLSAAAIQSGTQMTSVDLGAAERRIERLPWVADATVTRDWPGTVRINVIERVPVAVTDGPSPLLVDRDGRLLGSARGDEHLASIGPRPVGSAPGDVLASVQRARVRVVAAMPASLASEVETVSMDREGLVLVLGDGIVVEVGNTSRLRAKFDVVAARLAQPDRDTIATINVTAVDAPALTRKPTDGA
ncbi:MAG: FtsQ-type POTRA domain-containing protein [Acidimicrobiales bacterium]|nr:FtsQ-type POTRA domain-containing protein [Acidimicrobiales bacterium]